MFRLICYNWWQILSAPLIIPPQYCPRASYHHILIIHLSPGGKARPIHGIDGQAALHWAARARCWPVSADARWLWLYEVSDLPCNDPFLLVDAHLSMINNQLMWSRVLIRLHLVCCCRTIPNVFILFASELTHFPCSEYPIARGFIDARVQRIYAGSNEIMQELISRSIKLWVIQCIRSTVAGVYISLFGHFVSVGKVGETWNLLIPWLSDNLLWFVRILREMRKIN